VVNATPRPLYTLERPSTHFIGGWVGLIAGLDRCWKISPPPGFDPQTIQPVVSRCTDYTILAPNYFIDNHKKGQLQMLLNTFNLKQEIDFPTKIGSSSVLLIENLFLDKS
jgi:hypothetical protein